MSLAVRLRRVSRPVLVRPLVALAALAALIALAGCASRTAPPASSPAAAPPTASATPRPVEKIRFMAGFAPQANLPFVAAYVAQEQGYFAQEGLDVEIRHASGADEHLKLLLSKEIDFTTATAAQALRRSQDGLPTVALALFGQRGDQGYVVRADSGIKTPADFKGRTVGFKSGLVPAELDGMLKSAGLTRDDVKLVSVGFDPREFIEKKVDVYPVFLSNEPDTIRRAGVPITVLDPRDFGVPTLGLTYLAHRDTLQRGDVAERFLRATLRAAKWIDAHRDEAIAITLKYAKGADATHQRYLLDTDLANARRADGMLGRGAPEDWQALADLLTTYKVLPRRVDAQQAIDFSIVNRLYDAGQIK